MIMKKEIVRCSGCHLFCDGEPRIFNPSPIGRAALDMIQKYKEQTGATVVPNAVLEEAWGIAFHPTERKPFLSRKGNPRGASREVVKKPSFLKK